jgi:hypothetical protein
MPANLTILSAKVPQDGHGLHKVHRPVYFVDESWQLPERVPIELLPLDGFYGRHVSLGGLKPGLLDV